MSDGVEGEDDLGVDVKRGGEGGALQMKMEGKKHFGIHKMLT